MRKQSGFTFIELLIVVCILAILLAIAIPAYKEHLEEQRSFTPLVDECAAQVQSKHNIYGMTADELWLEAKAYQPPAEITISGVELSNVRQDCFDRLMAEVIHAARF